MTPRRRSPRPSAPLRILSGRLAIALFALAACDAGAPGDDTSMPPRERDTPPAEDPELSQTGDRPVGTSEEEGEEGVDDAPAPETPAPDDDEPSEEPPTP